MAKPLLDQVRSQIRARVHELEPAVRETELLEAALAALRSAGRGEPSSARPASPAPARPKRSAQAGASGRRAAKRAPRGANRAAVVGVLEQRPGVSASELASATGIARPVVYNLLKTLVERGEVLKEQLPGGTPGYSLADPSKASGERSSRRRS